MIGIVAVGVEVAEAFGGSVEEGGKAFEGVFGAGFEVGDWGGGGVDLEVLSAFLPACFGWGI